MSVAVWFSSAGAPGCPVLGRLNLGKTCHVRIPQDQTDVRVGDQASPRVHNISLAVFANLDL